MARQAPRQPTGPGPPGTVPDVDHLAASAAHVARLLTDGCTIYAPTVEPHAVVYDPDTFAPVVSPAVVPAVYAGPCLIGVAAPGERETDPGHIGNDAGVRIRLPLCDTEIPTGSTLIVDESANPALVGLEFVVSDATRHSFGTSRLLTGRLVERVR